MFAYAIIWRSYARQRHTRSCHRLMSAASPTNPPVLHNRYRILVRLGEGRLATVYRAEDERLRRNVLVYLLRTDLVQHAQLRRRFDEEARLGAQRSHPGLLDVFDSGDVGGRPFMVTEDVAGSALADALPLPASDALAVVRTVVSAVAHAQSQGAPHPPVSSRNVWLLDGGRAVLLENWAVGRDIAAREFAAYRAPELVAGAQPSPATTAYALGILAWEAFAGRRPFGGATADEIARQQQAGDPPPVSKVRTALFSPELDRVVAQAVAGDPGLRYQSPVDFARALDALNDASRAQTGRLPSPPYGDTSRAAPAPAQRRMPRLPLPGRRAAPPTAVSPPPPPPVLAVESTGAALAAAYDQRAVDQQIQRQVRREVRRQGCLRAVVKRSAQLLFAVIVLYALWIGVNYAVDYAGGQVARIDPGEWFRRQLPDVGSLVPSWLRDPGSLTATFRVAQPVNLRSQPRVGDETLLRLLDTGTLLQQVGPPQADAGGQAYEWIQVIVLPTAERGWVANQAGRLERQ